MTRPLSPSRLILFLFALLIPAVSGAQFENRYLPEDPYIPERLDLGVALDETGRPTGLYYNDVADERFAETPFLRDETFRAVYREMTGESHFVPDTQDPERAGVSLMIDWPEDAPEKTAATDGATTRPLPATVALAFDALFPRPRRFFLPVYALSETPRPVERNDLGEVLTLRVDRARGLFGDSAQRPRERLFFGKNAALDPASGEVRLPLMLPVEPFVIVAAEPPASLAGEPFDLAVSGVSPPAVRRLPDDPEGRARLFFLPQYDMPVVQQVALHWAPEGTFAPAPSPLRSTIANRFEILGGRGILDTIRAYENPDGAPIERIEILIPPDIEWESVASDPVCGIEVAGPERLIFTPLGDEPVSAVTLRLRGRFQIPLAFYRLPLPQDSSLAAREEIVIERPPHVSTTHAVALGVDRKLPKPEPRVSHHIVNDYFVSQYRRPGYPVINTFVRSTILQQTNGEHTISARRDGDLMRVREEIAMSDIPEEGVFHIPNPLEVWLPLSAEAKLGSIGLEWPDGVELAAADSPTTMTLEGTLLTLQWEGEAPERDGIVLEYAVRSEEAMQGGPRRNARHWRLPHTVVKGRNVREYEIAVESEKPFETLELGEFLVAHGALDQPRTEPLTTEALTEQRFEAMIVGVLEQRPTTPLIRFESSD